MSPAGGLAVAVIVGVALGMNTNESLNGPSDPIKSFTVCTLKDTFHQTESAVVIELLSRYVSVKTIGFPPNILAHDEVFALFFNKTCDLLPSVWLPDGHAHYVNPYIIGKDYDIAGTTSEEGTFYWAASKAAFSAGVTTLDDLLSPPPGMDPVIRCPDANTGLGMACKIMVDSLNSAGSNYSVQPSFKDEIEFLDSAPEDALYVVGTWMPWWGVQVYGKQLARLGSGKLGLAKPMGHPNRGVTLAQPGLLSSLATSGAAAALVRLFVGNVAISQMDTTVGYAKTETAAEAARKWANSSGDYGGAYWFTDLQTPPTDLF